MKQQVECQIDALQLGMDHFSCQLSACIIIIKTAYLQSVHTIIEVVEDLRFLAVVWRYQL